MAKLTMDDVDKRLEEIRSRTRPVARADVGRLLTERVRGARPALPRMPKQPNLPRV